MVLLGVRKNDRGLQVITKGYRRATGGYRGLQRVTKDYKGL